MAKYVVAAGGNSNDTNTWSDVSSASAGGDGVPAASDDVVLDSGSGNLTINAAMVCRSLDCDGATAYTGTLTHNASVTVSIGDATAGAGDVALRMSFGMTYTPLSTTSSAFAFVSTSATQQTITTGGKVLGNVTFNASSNGSWILSDAFLANGAATTTIDVTKGAFDSGSNSIGCGQFWSLSGQTRSATLGTSTVTCTGSFNAVVLSSGITWSASSATFILSGSSAKFDGGGLTHGTLNMTGSSTAAISGSNTFAAITRTGTASKNDTLVLSANQVVTSAFTVNSNSNVNRVYVISNTKGTARTITAASVVISNTVDFQDITGAGAATWTEAGTGATALGDAGGNSGITFTTPATQTATGTASFTWSTHGWTSRVPLPQDDVVVNNSFVAGQTVTMDMPRAGKSISFAGCSGSPTFTRTSNASFFGSMYFESGMTVSGTFGSTFEGRGAHTFASNGVAWSASLTLDAPGGSLTLADAFSSNSNILLNRGSLDFGGFSVSVNRILANGSSDTRALTLGVGVVNLADTTSPWTATATNFTLNSTGSTIKITDASANNKTFAGGGLTYGVVWSARGASTNSLTISGSNTFAEIKDTGTAAHSILFTAGTTQTVAAFNVTGSSGNVITINSTTTAVHYLTLTGGGTVSCDWLNIQHSVARPWSGAAGADTWFAGSNSTDNQATSTAGSGWIFTAPPGGGATIPVFMNQYRQRVG